MINRLAGRRPLLGVLNGVINANPLARRLYEVYAGGQASKTGGQNASLMGAQERTMIYTWLLWMVLQAIVLLRDVGPAG